MIRPPSRNGAAFSEASDGDLRNDPAARGRASRALDIPATWASVHQVHGGDVLQVSSPGEAGVADALWTTVTGLPVAVFTADCFGVVLHSDGAVGVAHAGWRGADSGVVANLHEEMTRAGHEPWKAEIGPGIGSCCFEVGPEVAERFHGHTTETTWGTTSVDLTRAISAQIEGVDAWAVDGCTHHEGAWFSHRRDATSQRLAALGWLP
jgi:YfiH family protein